MAQREWWVYVLECEGGALYTGIAVDVARRLAQHWRGTAAAYTRLRRPLRLVGAVKVGTRSDALRLEYAFKQLPASEKWRRATALGVPAEIARALCRSPTDSATAEVSNGCARGPRTR